MAFAASNLAAEPRAFSIGPVKMQILTFSVASADVSGTVTADALIRAESVIIGGGLQLTAAPTFSGNVVTLAFADPAATRYGTLIVYGK